MGEVLALRKIVLNLQFGIAAGEPVTRDRMLALVEEADAEKGERARARLTTTLAAVRDAAARDGYAVKGLPPTGLAAHQLADAGMPTTTLQRHLVDPSAAAEGRRHLYVLDESSVASTKHSAAGHSG